METICLQSLVFFLTIRRGGRPFSAGEILLASPPKRLIDPREKEKSTSVIVASLPTAALFSLASPISTVPGAPRTVGTTLRATLSSSARTRTTATRFTLNIKSFTAGARPSRGGQFFCRFLECCCLCEAARGAQHSYYFSAMVCIILVQGEPNGVVFVMTTKPEIAPGWHRFGLEASLLLPRGPRLLRA